MNPPLPKLSIFTAAAASLLLGACAPKHERPDLVFINGAEPETIDPAVVTDQVSMRVSNALFEGLCRNNANGKPEPGTAERWDVSQDKKTYTFHLRPSAQWSNGDPVTASDFVLSWRRVLEPATAADYASQLYIIRGARAFNEGTNTDFKQVGVRAVDDRTLEVALENPTPYFTDLCAFPTLAPVHAPTLAKHGTAWIKPENVVVNGPYLLRSTISSPARSIS
jgi:oligopeptide transport system substrate-binding protein